MGQIQYTVRMEPSTVWIFNVVNYSIFFFCRPDLIDYDGLRPNNAMSNLNNAFDVALKDLGISRLLDAEGTNYYSEV